MGLIRKALAIQTLGVVSPNSKKQRAAKQTNKLLAKQNRLLEGQRAIRPGVARPAAAPRYKVTCPGCKAALTSPAGPSMECPLCGYKMSVRPA